LLLASVSLGLASAGHAAFALAENHTSGPSHAVQVWLTTHDLRRALSAMPPLRFSATVPRHPLIRVNSSVRYQRIIGFGAAMTDSSAWLLYDELQPPAQTTVMQDLFGASGIHLDFVRIPIGASDFTATTVPYSYDDIPAAQTDPLLQGFSVSHDDAYVIPALRLMLRIDPQIWTLASPWTAPPWMKANDAFDDSLGMGALLPADYQPFADYFVRFIQAYEANGISIDAITPENEPNSQAAFPAMYLNEPAEQNFISQFLAPSLAAAGLHPRIYGLDGGLDSADLNLTYTQALLSGPAQSALSGIAWHCYGGMQSMSALHNAFPNVEQILTECSPGIIPESPVEVAIDATRNWASAAALWNLALDPTGGPVQPPDSGCQRCSGLVTISEQTHEATLRLSYYQFGQVSKFVQPGAVRIATPRFVSDFRTTTGAYGVTPGLDDVAFLNPDNTKVLIVYNSSPTAIGFSIAWRGKYVNYTLPRFGAATLKWR
jgi:glucosylceramidase